MKLVHRLVSCVFVCSFLSILWLFTTNSTDYTICRQLENSSSSIAYSRVVLSEEEEEEAAAEGGEERGHRRKRDPERPSEPGTAFNLTDAEYRLIGKAIWKASADGAASPAALRRLDFKPKRYYAIDDMGSAWVSFKLQITSRHLYPETSDSRIPELLDNLASLPIVRMRQKEGGSQLKLAVTLADGTKAIFKPMRFKREVETLPNHFYFSDYERHVAEIAAFHLDRILGFRRVPPTAGRYVNITQDIERLADANFKRTVFTSPAGNQCFHGRCSYYCDTGHAFCGSPDIIEGSMATYLPHIEFEADRITFKHPWRRSYNKRRKAVWENDPDFCRNESIVTRQGRRLNDIVDMAVFDFLAGNLDRHHYEIFRDFEDDGYPIMVDNGRGFGRSGHDEISILAPLYQCCRIRLSTLETLLRFVLSSAPLSDRMRRSLATDRLPSVLLEPHLTALDRRVVAVLRTVHKCLVFDEFEDIVVDDGY